MRAIWICAIAGVVWTATPAGGHVPSTCGELYLDAGRATERVVQKGVEANEQALAGGDVLDSASRYDLKIEYMLLADKVHQLVGQQMWMFETLTEAIECTHRE